MIEQCYKRHKTTLNPIIDWTDSEVWEFIRAENIPYCQLYNEGFSRLGCIGCPLAGKADRNHEFRTWPKYKAAYLYAFQVMLKERARKGKPTVWENPIEVFNWWMENGVLPDQYTLDGVFDE